MEYGSKQGDQMLQEVTRIIQENLPNSTDCGNLEERFYSLGLKDLYRSRQHCDSQIKNSRSCAVVWIERIPNFFQLIPKIGKKLLRDFANRNAEMIAGLHNCCAHFVVDLVSVFSHDRVCLDERNKSPHN
jgi:hypothetical protein